MSNWKQEVFLEYQSNPATIGRETARKYGVPQSTMFDHKKRIMSGQYSVEVTEPKVFLFDIETTPLINHNWSLWGQNVSLNQIQQDWYMLSWAGKWLGEDIVYGDILPNYSIFERDRLDDTNVIRSLVDKLEEADVVIGHNVKKFDIKKTKARMLKHGMSPLSSYRVVDTLDIAKEFALTSNKLDFLATFLGFDNKVSHEGHTLWTKCMAGDSDAWDKMMEYNVYDVELLEKVYLKTRGWFKKHPNMAVFYNDFKTRCTCCGSEEVEVTGKQVYTNLSSFDEYRCNNCGKVGRASVNNLSKDKRSGLLRNVI